jgi:Holliday junction resolvase RusA-like endonuclease
VTIVLRCSQAPPSVNRAWRMFRGRMTRSAEFRAWEKLALKEFGAVKSDLPALCYWSTVIFVPVIQHRPDLDNMTKACHDAIVRANLAPDDFYLVQTRLQYWAGNYLIIHLSEEPLEKWQAILKTTTTTARKMRQAKIAQSSPRLV